MEVDTHIQTRHTQKTVADPDSFMKLQTEKRYPKD